MITSAALLGMVTMLVVLALRHERQLARVETKVSLLPCVKGECYADRSRTES